MTTIEFVDRAIKVLSEDKIIGKRYQSDIQWFEIRKEKWKNDRLRIGVIGVTSSGKSTLINAIIGNELLSVAVKPSSSQLVSCSYSEEPSAKVFFKDGKKRVLSGDELTAEAVKRYSDEECNTNNKENVAQLELSTPNFDLGKDVLLIDSPGLDAYKLEAHERLTLETLIPTIDICIYVTTFKTNSDAKMLSFINTIAKYNCPVIIVQNMLDSVKPSLDGNKSVRKVAEEHKNRVVKIINISDIVDKEAVRIEQISAIYAMKSRCTRNNISEDEKKINAKNFEKSNYKNFIDAVNDTIKKQRPSIEQQRMRNVLDKLSNLVVREEVAIESISMGLSLSFQFEGLEAQIQKKSEAMGKKLKQLIDALSYDSYHNKNADNSVSALSKLIISPTTWESKFTEQTIHKIIDAVKECENNICNVITEYDKYLFSVIDQIGLTRRDIINFNGFPSVPELKLQTIKKSRRVRTKKSGVGNFFKRGWGFLTGDNDLGYDVRAETYTEINDTATKKELENYLKRVHKQYSGTVLQWSEKIQITVQNINNAIELERNSYNEKKQQVIEAKQLKEIMIKIESLIASIESNAANKKGKNNRKVEYDDLSDSEGLKTIKVNEIIVNIATLADGIITSINRNTLNSIFTNFKNVNKKNIIFGWDMNSCQTFAKRFFNIHFNTKNENKQNSNNKSEDVSIIVQPTEQDIKDIFSYNHGINVYVMTNAIQYGAAINQINNSRIMSALRAEDFIIFVVQDFNEILNGDAIVEGLNNMLHAKQDLLVSGNSIVLINHENPIYNLAFAQDQIEHCKNISEEIELQRELQIRFRALINSEITKNIGEILRVREK